MIWNSTYILLWKTKNDIVVARHVQRESSIHDAISESAHEVKEAKGKLSKATAC